MEKEYYAFISYSHEDEKWAKWIQRRLESYKLPTVIRKEIPRIPKHIRPVFRDRTDLNAGVLVEGIRKELNSSKYLIIICSPNSAKSDWVGREIAAFREMGREANIIPLIVDGKPHSGDDRTECFNPELDKAKDELLGIDVSELGKAQAFIRVVARILEIRFQKLWDRYKQQVIRQRIIRTVASLFLLCVLGWVLDCAIPHYKYYADYVDKWGIPEGIVNLTKEQVSHRMEHYRFEYRWRKNRGGLWGERVLQRVVHANSKGNVNRNLLHFEWDNDRAPILVLKYKDDGKLNAIDLRNAVGKYVVTYLYGGENFDVIDLKNETGGMNSILRSSYTSMDMESDPFFEIPLPTKSEIKCYKLERNEEGYIIRKEFMKYNGSNIPCCDEDGIHGFKYELDNYGRITNLFYLNIDGNVMPDKRGVMEKRCVYDERGNIKRIDFLGENGKPVLNEYGWSGMEVSGFDDYGNHTEEFFFGVDGKPCESLLSGAKCVCKIDKHGQVTDLFLFGIDGKPYLNSLGFAKVKNEYEEKNGNEIEQSSFYGVDGKLCWIAEGYAKLKTVYDRNGCGIESSYYGVDGKPCSDKDGVAKMKCKYDELGNVIEKAYYGINEKLCLGRNGYARWIRKYEGGNLKEESYYGIDGKLCLRKDGFAKVESKYDKHGNRIEESYYGVNGMPCLCNEGYARTKCERKYDERENVIAEQSYYGVDGKPCLNNGGYARVKCKYDKRGNLKEQSYYGLDGQPCLDKDGISKIEWEYDERGNKTEESYYGIDGKLCLCAGGYAKMKSVYDKRGNLREHSCYGVNGKPCLSYEGFAKVKWEYNERGNLKEESYYGLDGNLCLCKNGYAKVKWEYNERGIQTEESYYGVDGMPCLHKNGFAKVKYEYNSQGNLLKIIQYGVNNDILKEFDLKKDEEKASPEALEEIDTKKLEEQIKKLEEKKEELTNVESELSKKKKEIKEKFSILEEDDSFIGWQKMLSMVSFVLTGKELVDEKRENLDNRSLSKFENRINEDFTNVYEWLNQYLKYNRSRDQNAIIYVNAAKQYYKAVLENQLKNTGILVIDKENNRKQSVSEDKNTILIGDIILEVNGKSVDDFGDYIVLNYISGKELNSLKIARFDEKGNMKIFDLQVSDSSIVKNCYSLKETNTKYGIMLMDVSIDGKAFVRGLRGTYIVLKYCGCELGASSDIWDQEISSNKDKNKEMILLDGKGKIQSLKFEPGLIGVWFNGVWISDGAYESLKERYEKYKKELKKNEKDNE